jgi:hypothetical protein
MIEERQPSIAVNTIVRRCLNCGLLTDALIEQNRHQHMREKAAA